MNLDFANISLPYLAAGVSSLFWIGFLWLTRKITFASLDTDDEKQVKAAAQHSEWRWLSDMHNCGTIKTNTKDGMILLLVLFQKLFRNNCGERPLMALYGFSVAVSGLLIFFIGSNYWGESIGFWLMILYLFSVWPWQTALYGGHVGVATMAFLASVLTMQQITPDAPNFLILMAVGILFCFMVFSSGSSTKYIPFSFAALFTSKFYPFLSEKGTTAIIEYLSKIDFGFDIIVLAGISLSFIIFKIAKKFIVDILYNNQSSIVKKLNIIRGQALFPREYYYKHADKKLPKYFKNLAIAYIGLSAIIHLIGWSYLFPFLFGFLSLFLVFTLPNVKLNTKNYLRHVIAPARKTRFEKYVGYFAKRGMNIAADFRAPLLQWLVRVSWRIAPLQTLLLIGLLALTFSSPANMTSKIFILLVALLPVFWGEITRSTRSLRTYSPALLGILLFAGYASADLVWPQFWLYFLVLTGAIATHQIWSFFTDVYPARMAISNLTAELNKRNISEFYTYKTNYNNILADALNLERPINKKYKINYIEKLSDVKEGWVVVPPTNSKSLTMECDPEGMEGHFTRDPELNKLLETKKIEQVATAKFKTFSSSKIWPQEADVATYMDLILKEISPDDRYRGHAWLVDAQKLSELTNLPK